ncbi:hypothetical protein M427DRAFT_483720 [Gonapodya prolifera JEL478]|uniref:Uncharacterized protein n=1 Tax=Gonapodya prolifera (strain JEL478) TaxID=1344416 RepID=A0A139A0X0_GONPJ|nr:hypothetical protein M427DRAFT_483720 [Gonapodya prolifera JEL478]|eukprot:KXS10427.1 hypothetical protein M427DRAFT_483720 [Gonapodya prolifera JEL478]
MSWMNNGSEHLSGSNALRISIQRESGSGGQISEVYYLHVQFFVGANEYSLQAMDPGRRIFEASLISGDRAATWSTSWSSAQFEEITSKFTRIMKASELWRLTFAAFSSDAPNGTRSTITDGSPTRILSKQTSEGLDTWNISLVEEKATMKLEWTLNEMITLKADLTPVTKMDDRHKQEKMLLDFLMDELKVQRDEAKYQTARANDAVETKKQVSDQLKRMAMAQEAITEAQMKAEF